MRSKRFCGSCLKRRVLWAADRVCANCALEHDFGLRKLGKMELDRIAQRDMEIFSESAKETKQNLGTKIIDVRGALQRLRESKSEVVR